MENELHENCFQGGQRSKRAHWFTSLHVSTYNTQRQDKKRMELRIIYHAAKHDNNKGTCQEKYTYPQQDEHNDWERRRPIHYTKTTPCRKMKKQAQSDYSRVQQARITMNYTKSEQEGENETSTTPKILTRIKQTIVQTSHSALLIRMRKIK